jgi:elongation factor Tu
MPQTRDHLKIARQAGVPVVVVFLNKIDAADKSLTPLVEMEIRELMTLCGYAGDKAAIVRGSASLALKGDESDIGMPSIRRLLDALGEGRAIVAQNPAAEPNPSVSKSGGWGESILRLFSR